MSKDEFVKSLTSEGFDAGYSNGGIPTVFVESELDINEAHRAVKEAMHRLGYTQSYGIRIKKTEEFKAAHATG